MVLGLAGGSGGGAQEPGGATSEHFLVEWSGDAPHPARSYQGNRGLERAAREGAVGLVALRRRQVDGGWQLEQDILFPFEGVRLLAVECLDARSPRLVWREITPSGGRTIFAEWTAQSERLKSVEWGADGSLRESIGTSRGAVMPQYLLELARRGRIAAGRFEVFDPCSGRLEPWSVELSYNRSSAAAPVSSVAPEYLRRLEFRRADGTLAGSYEFDGTRLVRFQWQAGSLRARSISAQEFAELRQRWGLEEQPEGAPEALGGVKDL
jgi:hypothetical protein